MFLSDLSHEKRAFRVPFRVRFSKEGSGLMTRDNPITRGDAFVGELRCYNQGSVTREMSWHCLLPLPVWPGQVVAPH